MEKDGKKQPGKKYTLFSDDQYKNNNKDRGKKEIAPDEESILMKNTDTNATFKQPLEAGFNTLVFGDDFVCRLKNIINIEKIGRDQVAVRFDNNETVEYGLGIISKINPELFIKNLSQLVQLAPEE